jgi:hypothetical protein
MISLKQCKQIARKNQSDKRRLYNLWPQWGNTFRLEPFSHSFDRAPTEEMNHEADICGYRTCIYCAETIDLRLKNNRHIGDYYQKTCSNDCQNGVLQSISTLKKSRIQEKINHRSRRRQQLFVIQNLFTNLSDLRFSGPVATIVLNYGFSPRKVRQWFRRKSDN